MNKLNLLKIALLIVILAEEIKRAKKDAKIKNSILSVKSDVSELESKISKSVGIKSIVNKYGAHQQMHDKNGDLMMSHSVIKK